MMTDSVMVGMEDSGELVFTGSVPPMLKLIVSAQGVSFDSSVAGLKVHCLPDCEAFTSQAALARLASGPSPGLLTVKVVSASAGTGESAAGIATTTASATNTRSLTPADLLRIALRREPSGSRRCRRQPRARRTRPAPVPLALGPEARSRPCHIFDRVPNGAVVDELDHSIEGVRREIRIHGQEDDARHHPGCFGR